MNVHLVFNFPVLLTFVIGVFLLWSAVRNFRSGSASRDWPQVIGTVSHSDVKIEHYIHRGQRRTGYTPEIEYDYSVEGKEYSGNRLRYGGQNWISVRAQADQIIAQFPVGTQVPVFVNPQNPQDAVLQTGVSKVNFAFAAGGLIFLTVSVLISIYSK